MMNDGAAMKKFETAARKLERMIAELAECPKNRAELEKSTLRALDRLFMATDVNKLGGDASASDAAYVRWQSVAAARNAACERCVWIARDRAAARADMALPVVAKRSGDIALEQYRKELAVTGLG